MAKKPIKEQTKKKDSEIAKSTKKVLKKVNDENVKLTVKGLYLPEKLQKENLLQRSYYIKPSLYEKVYKISQKIDASINLIHVTLLEQFVNENKHLLNEK